MCIQDYRPDSRGSICHYYKFWFLELACQLYLLLQFLYANMHQAQTGSFQVFPRYGASMVVALCVDILYTSRTGDSFYSTTILYMTRYRSPLAAHTHTHTQTYCLWECSACFAGANITVLHSSAVGV